MRALSGLAALLIGACAGAQNLEALTLSRTKYVGGDPIEAVVTLTGPAPSGGKVVALDDNSTSVTTPAQVTVPESKDGIGFVSTTFAVGAPATRSITATLSGVSKVALFTLLPAPTLVSIEITPNDIVGGDEVLERVTLSGPAWANGAPISLSSNTAAIQLGSTTYVNPGTHVKRLQGTSSRVGAVYVRQVSATLNGVTRTANVTLHPQPVLVEVRLQDAIVKGGELTGLMFRLSGRPRSQGSQITLIDDSPYVTLPNPVIPRDEAAYTVTTTTPPSDQLVEITCQLDNVVRKVYLVVTP